MPRRLVLLLLLSVASTGHGAAGPGVSFDAVSALSAPAPQRREAYGSDALQFGELWLPAAPAPAPVVVLVHGGCWLNAYGVDHARPLAAALAGEGLAVWALEYRRVGDAGGGWPGTGQDVLAGIAHLARLAGTAPLDLGRVALVGHSAGGHLVLWAGGALPDDAPVQPVAVVGLAARQPRSSVEPPLSASGVRAAKAGGAWRSSATRATTNAGSAYARSARREPLCGPPAALRSLDVATATPALPRLAGGPHKGSERWLY